MAWNGSGTFSRVVTTVSPATGNTTIDVADQNIYTADVTAGVNATIAKNGENTATGNLPMGGFRHTGVDDGVASDDYATMSQLNEDVGFDVANTAASSITRNVAIVVPWPTETRDPGANFATNGYVVPTDGVYQFNAAVSMAVDDTSELELFLYKDPLGVSSPAAWKMGQLISNGGPSPTHYRLQISASGLLTATDIIYVYIKHTNASDTVLSATAGRNYFDGFRISNTT